MKLHKFFGLLCISLLLISCDDTTETVDTGQQESYPIVLNGAASETTMATRAVSDFPNNQKIGVLAAEYQTGSIDWTSYADIDNAEATATREQAGTFYFTWATQKYWPFDGGKLVFMAYSPVANGSSVVLSPDRKSLTLNLQSNMPEVMYASNNDVAETTPYSKDDGIPVSLGEFRHALSKITVNVIADSTMNPAVRLDSLIIETQFPTAELDLLAGDSGLTLGTPGKFHYNVVTSATDFSVNNFNDNVLLFPETENATKVFIKFSDGYFSVRKWYDIADFDNDDNNGNPLKFERGVNTVLNITVKGTQVQEPNDNVILQGKLTDWLDKGEYEVIIKQEKE